MDENEVVVFPKNLAELSDEDLTALDTRARERFDTLAANEDIDDADLAQLEELATGIEGLAAARTERGAVAATTAATATERRERRDAALARVPRYTKKSDKDDDGDDDDTVDASVVITEPTVTAAAAGEQQRRRTASLQAAQERAPAIAVGANGQNLAITAAAPVAGMTIGTQFSTVEQLADAFTAHSKGLVTSHGNPGFLTVASIQNQFDHRIHGDRTTHSEFDDMLRSLRARGNDFDSLVAAGGWCAPSEIRYDFFNIVCQDGGVDLPTFGVERGGIQFPVSPSLADVFTGTFTNATNPWLWTESDDILAATGAPTKPCVRVMCPDFDDERLECYGICLTAGNLTDSAYPEAVRNHLALLMAAHFHAQNQRYIQRMVALSSPLITMPTNTTGILADFPDAVAIAAQDYRTRFGMCDDDVLEVIAPRWVRDAMRSDHSRRGGFWSNALTDAEIDALFASRRVRVQWVNDWQIRGEDQFGQPAATAAEAWPATVDFMIFAAGTFIRGNGLTLDLGVVRDSVLNETNDHTAAWTEECHLIARVGHESRQYRMSVCVGGVTGAANSTHCFVAA